MQSLVLGRLAENGRASAIATVLGVSEATISRLKNEHLETLCAVLAHAGLKIVEAEAVCVDAATYRAVTHIATKAMANPTIAEQIVLGEG